MPRAVNINPAILPWARAAAGLSLEDAAARAGISGKESSAAEKLAEMEAGLRPISRSQLAALAALYRRPLITFYLTDPPVRGERGEDFRRPSPAVSRREEALLDALLRDTRARQEMVKELLLDEEDVTPRPFVGSAQIQSGVIAVVRDIAARLRFPFESVEARRGGADALFRTLRTQAEAAGVFVLLAGDLGSHHSAISAEVFRGFAIADEIAPFVVINDKDARAARSFTLIHELAHIWLGRSGVSGPITADEPRTTQGQIERFCNDVAGEFLLPEAALIASPPIRDKQTAREAIAYVAAQWSVSEPMAAYRVHRHGRIPHGMYEELASEYAERWRSVRQRERDARGEDDGGPSYYVVKQSKLGNALIDVVLRTLRENNLTHTKAAKVLGVKPASVEPLLRGFEKSRRPQISETRR